MGIKKEIAYLEQIVLEENLESKDVTNKILYSGQTIKLNRLVGITFFIQHSITGVERLVAAYMSNNELVYEDLASTPLRD